MEAVNHNPVNPKHYDKYPIQPIDFIAKNGLGFLEGNVIKYVVRYKDKNGLEDLMKAKSYLDRLIKEAREAETAKSLINFARGDFNGA